MTRCIRALFVIACAAILAWASPAAAQLEVQITGTPGAGTSTWTFSGSGTATGNGVFPDGTVSGGADGWQDLGTYWTGTTLTGNLTPTSGSATVTVDGMTYNMERVRFGFAPAVQYFMAYAVDGGGADVTFGAGDTVSWSGSWELPYDVTEFSFGSSSDNGIQLDVYGPSIREPFDGQVETIGSAITFSGTVASDWEWSSSIDGAFGTGPLFTDSALSEGLHRITLTSPEAACR